MEQTGGRDDKAPIQSGGRGYHSTYPSHLNSYDTTTNITETGLVAEPLSTREGKQMKITVKDLSEPVILEMVPVYCRVLGYKYYAINIKRA